LLDPGIMAEDTLGSGRDAVTPLVAPARRAAVGDGDRLDRPLGISQDRVGLIIVPDVGIRPPGVALEVKDLGLDAPAAERLPATLRLPRGTAFPAVKTHGQDARATLE